jgi:Fe-Mn family superoxide dismutase
MTQGLERRDFIHGVAVAGAVTAAALPERPAFAQTSLGTKPMTYDIKPLARDPKSIEGLSEKLLMSHYENNYGGAVKRLNAITVQLAKLDFAKAPVFMINGLKREELIATAATYVDTFMAAIRWSNVDRLFNSLEG